MSDTSTLRPAPDRRVKVGHLVVGLVFLGLAGAWALHAAGVLGGLGGAVVVPLVLVVAGLLGLVAMVVGGIRRRRTPAYAAGPAEQPARSVAPDRSEPAHRTGPGGETDERDDPNDRDDLDDLLDAEERRRPDPSDPPADPMAGPDGTEETAPLATRRPGKSTPDQPADQPHTHPEENR